MRLIKLTSIENRKIAIVVDEIMSVERGDYISEYDRDWREYGFSGCPTRVFLKNSKYSVREDFETVCMLIEGAGRPQGEWKPKNHHTDYCSECGFEETQWRTTEYRFCPYCGARMKGVDDADE